MEMCVDCMYGDYCHERFICEKDKKDVNMFDEICEDFEPIKNIVTKYRE